jgi:hypothetical protein
MKCFFLSLSLFAGLASASFADALDPALASFSHLTSLKVADLPITLLYDPALSEKLPGPHPQGQELENEGIFVVRPLRSQLLGAGKGFFTIDCDSGPSDDFQCTIWRETSGGLEGLISLSGLRFIFPGNGHIYVDGHMGTMFNQRRKFSWQNDEFVEVVQPFFYVGLESKTRREIRIFASKALEEPVALLPKGAPVAVLLADGDFYLLRTAFGLVGWIKVDVVLQDESPIDGLFFAGD